MRIYTNQYSDYRYLNHTKVTEAFASLPRFLYHSPRMDTTYTVYSGPSCRNLTGWSVSDPTWKYLGAYPGDPCASVSPTDSSRNCVAQHCLDQNSARMFL